MHRAATERNRQGTNRSVRRVKQRSDLQQVPVTQDLQESLGQEEPVVSCPNTHEAPLANNTNQTISQPQLKPVNPQTSKRPPKPRIEADVHDPLNDEHLELISPPAKNLPGPLKLITQETQNNTLATQDIDVEHEYEHEDDLADFSKDLTLISSERLHSPEFKELLENTLTNLIVPITGIRVLLTVRIEDSRVVVHIDAEDDSGILIGRDGQTLLAIQYIATRILIHKLGQVVHLQLDTGEYRDRQRDKIKEMALALAEKVRTTGRPHSTKPLSSYKRKIVHMTLQDVDDIQTKSIGYGIMKRVAITLRDPS